MKTYKIKRSNKLCKKLQPFALKYEMILDKKRQMINSLNDEMAKATGIKDIEICEFETGWGIGNESRTMALYHDYELMQGRLDEEA